MKAQALKYNDAIDLLPNLDRTCLLLPGLFRLNECDELLQLASQIGFSSASEKYPKSYRNNDRIQLDDEPLANRIFSRCADHIPKYFTRNGLKVSIHSLNSRLRFCRYKANQQFTIHRDGVYYPSKRQQSVLTFLLFLNDASEFGGGTTSFYGDQFGQELLARYQPRKGDVLIFEHDIWHSGDTVTQGCKYILRSDFIYQYEHLLCSNETNHKGYIWTILGLANGGVISAGRDKTIKIWNHELNLTQELNVHQNSVLDLSMTSNNDLLAASRDGHISRWKLLGSRYELDFYKDTGHPCVLSVTELGNENVVTTGSDNLIRMWSNKGEQVACSDQFSDWIWQAKQLDCNHLICCGADGKLAKLDANSLTLLSHAQLDLGSIRAIAIDKEKLVVGTESGYVAIVCPESFQVHSKWRAHKGIVRDVLLFNSKIYTCGEDNRVKCFDNQKLVSSYRHSDFVTSLAVVDGRVYSASYDGVIQEFAETSSARIHAL